MRGTPAITTPYNIKDIKDLVSVTSRAEISVGFDRGNIDKAKSLPILKDV